jgi:hypothetical protein
MPTPIQAFENLGDFLGDNLSVFSGFGTAGTGLADDRVAINRAIASTPYGGTLTFPKADYLIKDPGTVNELLLVYQPIKMIFHPGARLLLDTAARKTVNVMRLVSSTGDGVPYAIQGMRIRPVFQQAIVNTTGTAVSRTSGDPFTANMAGLTIRINSAVFTVATFTDASNLTLTASAGTQSGVALSVRPGQHGIVIDTTSQPIYACTFEDISIQSLGGWGIKTVNPTRTDGFFTSTFRKVSTFDLYGDGGVVNGGGVDLERAGDSITFDQCVFAGDQIGVRVNMIPGAHGLMFFNCNSTSKKGAIHVLCADVLTIDGGNLEVTGGPTTGTANPAVVYLEGLHAASMVSTTGTAVVWISGDKFTQQMVGLKVNILGNNWTVVSLADDQHMTLAFSPGNSASTPFAFIFKIKSALLEPRYLGVADIQRGITVDYAVDANISSAFIDVGYGPGTPGSNEMVNITANADTTIVGSHVNFGNALPSRQFLDQSTSTKYPPVVAPHYNSAVLLDPAGTALARSLVTDGGSLGLWGNLLKQSNAFGTANWTLAFATVAASGVGPDGVTTATKLIEDATLHDHYVGQYRSTGPSDGDRVYFSAWLKAGTRKIGVLNAQDGTGGNGIIGYFQLDPADPAFGKVIFFQSLGSATEVDSFTIPYPNGWFRCVVTCVTHSFPNLLFQIATAIPGLPPQIVYTGDGSSYIQMFGACYTIGAFGPYVPTTSAGIGPFRGICASAVDSAPGNYLEGKVTYAPNLAFGAAGDADPTIELIGQGQIRIPDLPIYSGNVPALAALGLDRAYRYGDAVGLTHTGAAVPTAITELFGEVIAGPGVGRQNATIPSTAAVIVSLRNDLNAEIARATAAENANATATSNERTRAMAAESSISLTPGPPGPTGSTGSGGAPGPPGPTGPTGPPSDRRLKENLQLVGRIKNVNIYEFNFIGEPARERGCIAQELYLDYPECVHVGGKDEALDPWRVDYARLMKIIGKFEQGKV